jgi:HK97 gp10 family phage protein
MRVSFQVNGLKELEAALATLPQAVGERVIEGATRKGANEMKRLIREAAPVRQEGGTKRLSSSRKNMQTREPGNLKRNIITDKIRNSRLASAIAAGPSTDAFYGAMYEFGSKHQRERPFVGPTIEQNAEAIGQLVVNDLAKGLEREAKRLMRGVSSRYLTKGRY